jgi:hypothetical protein
MMGGAGDGERCLDENNLVEERKCLEMAGEIEGEEEWEICCE